MRLAQSLRFPKSLTAVAAGWTMATCVMAAPSDSAIEALLQERVVTHRKTPALVVALLEAGQPPRFFAAGQLAKAAGDGRPAPAADADTLFEIGSVTKALTGTWLAARASAGVRLETPVSEWLPASVKLGVNGRPITLLDLATQRSGLPRLPANLATTAADPYARYDRKALYAFLDGYQPPAAAGSRYEYSNLGFGLLGDLLARQAGKSYEAGLKAAVLDPLGMQDTWVDVPAAAAGRMAQGHTAAGTAAPAWHFDALAGAGALRSSARDLARWVAVALRPEGTPLAAALELSLRPQRDAEGAGRRIALGWQITRTPMGEMVWHNGATAGFASFVGLDRKAGRGVVVLANAHYSVDDLGAHLLDDAVPLAKVDPAAGRKTVTMTAEQLLPLTGRYELKPGFVIAVMNDGNRLYAQATRQAGFELFAEGPRRFFAKAADIQIEFQPAEGPVTGLLLRQGRHTLPGPRLPDPQPMDFREAGFEAYARAVVGRYGKSGALSLELRREGDQLVAQAEGQAAFVVVPVKADRLVGRTVDIELEVHRGDDGKASRLTLHQNGNAFPLHRW